MQRLVSTNEAAQILGISLQGVHYRIKNDQLKSKKENGKTYVFIDEKDITPIPETSPQPVQTQIIAPSVDERKIHEEYTEKLLAAKDEQIEMLKESIKWIKKQYKSEIARLEHNQKRIIKVFDGEIKLLQSAFTEMRSVYTLENKSFENEVSSEIQNSDIDEHIIDHEEEIVNADEIDEIIEDSSSGFISMKEFYTIMKTFGKTDSEIKLIILDRIKKEDERFLFNKENKEITIQKDDFLDLA